MLGHAQKRWEAVALCGALLGACSKPGGATEGPAAEAEAEAGGSEVGPAAGVRELVAQEQAPPQDEPGVVREGCPAGMVRIEGNETLKPFCMGETEVSVREFRRCVEAGKCRAFDPTTDFHDETKATWLLGDDSMPINYVDEEQARQYCAFVGGRLPTEAEWIWAYGSAKGWSFPWGDEFSYDTASYCGRWQTPGRPRYHIELCPPRQHPQDRTLQGVYEMAGSANEIVGPNENGMYGTISGLAYHGLQPDDHPTGTEKVRGKPDASYGGALPTWRYSTSFRCVSERPQ